MKIVEFIFDRTIKCPKRLQNNVFAIYSPERIRLQPGGNAKLDMKVSIRPSNQNILGCTLLPTFCENGLKLKYCFYIAADDNTNNLNQPINLLWKLQFELVNRSLNTTFLICKRQEIAHVTPLNEGLDELKVIRFFFKIQYMYYVYKLIKIYFPNCLNYSCFLSFRLLLLEFSSRLNYFFLLSFKKTI